MTEGEAKKMLSMVADLVRRIVKSQTGGCVKRSPAIVVSVENEMHYATVVLPENMFDKKGEMRLMNCTGKDLYVGDKVMIEYTYSMSDAFIAIKNDGKPWGW